MKIHFFARKQKNIYEKPFVHFDLTAWDISLLAALMIMGAVASYLMPHAQAGIPLFFNT